MNLKNGINEGVQSFHFLFLQVEWFCNGKPIAQGHRFRTMYDFGYVALDILYAYPEDNGTYTCKATNTLGEVTTSCTLEVQAKSGLILDTVDDSRLTHLRNLERRERPRVAEEESPITKPVFLTKLNNVQGVIEQGQVHLECRLEPLNDPNLRVEWYVNGKEIKTGHRFRTMHDFGFVALDILYAYGEDSGTYTCRAVNHLGEAINSCSVEVLAKSGLLLDTMDDQRLTHLRNLERREKPRMPDEETQITKPVFLTPLNNVQGILEQGQVHLECRLEPINDPNLRVEWYVNEKEIRTGHRFRTMHDFGFVALDILYAYAEDSGTYMCRAVNQLGEATNTCSVEVLGKRIAV